MTDHAFLRHEVPGLAGMAGAAVARTAIKSAYSTKKGTEPPVNPAAEEVSWRQAILWTAVIAAGAGVGQLISRYVVSQQVDKRLSGQRQVQKAD